MRPVESEPRPIAAEQRPVEAEQRTAEDQPRIVEEHHGVDPYDGEYDEVVDEFGRHFWSFRPTSRTPYDVWGFGWFWWAVLWAVIIGLIVWGWGWGWAY